MASDNTNLAAMAFFAVAAFFAAFGFELFNEAQVMSEDIPPGLYCTKQTIPNAYYCDANDTISLSSLEEINAE